MDNLILEMMTNQSLALSKLLDELKEIREMNEKTSQILREIHNSLV